MAKKGESSHLKRIASSRALKVRKKEHVWITKTGPGPHPADSSVPLAILLRDYLGLASTMKESKHILKNADVLVDGRIVKRRDLPVGIMDVITIPKLERSYKVAIDSKQRLVLREIEPKDAGKKLCKVKRKMASTGGKIFLGLHDGKTVQGDKNYNVGDTVLISIPEQKIEKLFKLAPGARCLITNGKHAGKVGKLKELRQVGDRKIQAIMEHEEGDFITVKPYLFVVEG